MQRTQLTSSGLTAHGNCELINWFFYTSRQFVTQKHRTHTFHNHDFSLCCTFFPLLGWERKVAINFPLYLICFQLFFHFFVSLKHSRAYRPGKKVCSLLIMAPLTQILRYEWLLWLFYQPGSIYTFWYTYRFKIYSETTVPYLTFDSSTCHQNLEVLVGFFYGFLPLIPQTGVCFECRLLCNLFAPGQNFAARIPISLSFGMLFLLIGVGLLAGGNLS